MPLRPRSTKTPPEILRGRCLRNGLNCYVLLARAQAAPVLKCNQTSFDFGSATNYATVRHAFQICNAGNEPLTLSARSVCCGATAALPPEPIQSSATGTVVVTINVGGRSGDFHKAIYLSSNDPTQPLVRLVVTGKVQVGVSDTISR